MATRKRILSDSKVPSRKIPSSGIEAPTKRDWSEWVAATAIRNHMLGEPLLDFLAYHSVPIAAKHPQLAATLLESVSTRGSLFCSTPGIELTSEGPAASSFGSFTSFLMNKGCEFEEAFMALVFRTFTPADVRDIGGSRLARSEEKFLATQEAMREGIPIIYSGVLHNPENQTYGVPDLIVRSDWLNRLVEKEVLTEEEARVSAPGLRTGRVKPGYHYRIVDIKFTTLLLKADGVHLLNSASFPAYKGQLCIYNDALALIQNYKPPQAYLLGRKWSYVSRSQKYSGDRCTDRLGVVNFDIEGGADKDFPQKTADAVVWVKTMRKNGADWVLLPRPSHPELWPNMCNEHDQPFSKTKEVLARELKEITDLWMCGPKNRTEAHLNGIYGWGDEGCNAEKLGIHGTRGEVLDCILDANLDTSSQCLFPLVIKNNAESWQHRQSVEFFVDFEFTSDVADDFTNLPKSGSTPCIFMIGVGFYDTTAPVNLGSPYGKWTYRSFIADSLDRANERKICQDFSDYVQTQSRRFRQKSPLLVHWSAAEKWQWSAAYERYGGLTEFFVSCSSTSKESCGLSPRWFDLLEVFKSEPICVKGVRSFGLKKISKGMRDAGLISVDWASDSATADGSGAMLGAFLAAKDASKRGISLAQTAQMKDIERYNETDCKALAEIISVLRKKFIG